MLHLSRCTKEVRQHSWRYQMIRAEVTLRRLGMRSTEIRRRQKPSCRNLGEGFRPGVKASRQSSNYNPNEKTNVH